MDDQESLEKIFTKNPKDTREIALLREWLSWYMNTEDFTKMPDSLHTRTAVFLAEKTFE